MRSVLLFSLASLALLSLLGRLSSSAHSSAESLFENLGVDEEQPLFIG